MVLRLKPRESRTLPGLPRAENETLKPANTIQKAPVREIARGLLFFRAVLASRMRYFRWFAAFAVCVLLCAASVRWLDAPVMRFLGRHYLIYQQPLQIPVYILWALLALPATALAVVAVLLSRDESRRAKLPSWRWRGFPSWRRLAWPI